MPSSKNLSAAWDDISLAMKNKIANPDNYERFFIGGIQNESLENQSQEKKLPRVKKQNWKSFRLSSPLLNVKLTPREVEVLHFTCQGLTNCEVAVKAGLSPRTVEYYIHNIRKKTETRNKRHLIQQILKTDFMRRAEMLLVKPDRN